jgi:hypothetical protein
MFLFWANILFAQESHVLYNSVLSCFHYSGLSKW